MSTRFLIKLQPKVDKLIAGLDDESLDEWLESDFFFPLHEDMGNSIIDVIQAIETVSGWSSDGKVAYLKLDDMTYLFPNSNMGKIGRWLLDHQKYD